MSRLSHSQILAGIVTLVVAGAIAAGVYVLGSPTAERSRRLDERRVDHLADIAQLVDLYWTRHSRLPASLDELRREAGSNFAVADPVTNQAYEYRPANDRFELCAVFETASERTSPHRGTFWSHRTGRQCFEREVKKVR